MSLGESYLETRVLTSPPQQLHLIVVEAALRYAKIGREALVNKNFEQTSTSLGRSRDCVNEMLVGLNADHDAEMTDRLKGLFLFIHRNLVQADLTHTVEPIDAAIRILESHRDTWRELLSQLPKETPLAGPHSQSFTA